MLFDSIIIAMFCCDLLWWRWADRLLRKRKIARIVLGIFMGVQFACFVSIVFGRVLDWRVDERMPLALVIAVFIWHFLALSLGTLFMMIDRIGRKKQVVPIESENPAPESPQPTHPTRRDFLRTAAIVAPPLATFVATGVAMEQVDDFRVRSFDLQIPQLPAELDGLVIAHVSDMHVGKFSTDKMLRKLVEETNKFRADLVLLTGDLIDHSIADLPAALDVVKQMDARFGVYMCEGNHDMLAGRAQFEDAVKNSGVSLLVNESTMLKVRGRDVQLLGLRWGPIRNDASINMSMKELLPLRVPEAFPILLAHHPHAFDPAAAAQLPLTLCGHTHGGQLMLTQNFGVGSLMFRYWSGLYERGDSKLIVSNGVGNWFPLRINAPAEIARITLHKE